jgi:hypothetical protein
VNEVGEPVKKKRPEKRHTAKFSQFSAKREDTPVMTPS